MTKPDYLLTAREAGLSQARIYFRDGIPNYGYERARFDAKVCFCIGNIEEATRHIRTCLAMKKLWRVM